MLQLAVRNVQTYSLLERLPKSDKYLRFDLRAFSTLEDEELLGRLYRRVGLHGGITKQTSPNRFEQLNSITLDLLKELDHPQVHDVGVSSGITSVELYEFLTQQNLQFKLTVSDRYAQFYWQRSGLAEHIFDADGRLQCSYMLGLYADRHTNWKYPLSMLLHHRAPTQMHGESRKFLLYHPKLLALLEAHNVTHRDYDVLTSEGHNEYQYVRCMNLLNSSYFPEADLTLGLRTIASSMADNGVLQVGRTNQDGDNHASFYSLQAGQFRLIDQYGDGSEIDSLIRSAHCNRTLPDSSQAS